VKYNLPSKYLRKKNPYFLVGEKVAMAVGKPFFGVLFINIIFLQTCYE
jgi:hypothetical protein